MNMQKGISLIELLIAMAIGVLVTFGAYELLIANKATFQLIHGLAALQENGLFLTDFLQYEIRTAGYIGCSQLSSSFPIVNHVINKKNTLSLDTAIMGFHYSNAKDTGIYQDDLEPHSDILVINKMSVETVALTAKTKDKQPLSITSNALFKQGDIAIISDCRHADIFSITKLINPTELESNVALPHYDQGAEIGFLQSDTLFVADTHRSNFKGHKIYALYLRDYKGRRHELVEGVKTMLIRYDVADNNQQRQINLTAKDIKNWSLVRAVHISFLLTSIEDVHPQKQHYTFDKKRVYPEDRRLYRQWNVAASLRERSI